MNKLRNWSLKKPCPELLPPPATASPVASPSRCFIPVDVPLSLFPPLFPPCEASIYRMESQILPLEH
ncbi:unnamed protein product [Cuscuta campestris]|uniref:Uncharacterized protein n=1 Tax=Cuscuta campestris TaxID=132261 RepID=A0A484LTF9_9ASTE|nr:unnamed protein product [Cuscuta campestris]VFQ92801.1 unnamed protein product [Cuscuta campestris]